MAQTTRRRGLYAIIDLPHPNPLSYAHALLNGGANAIQLRAKGIDKGDILQLSRDLATSCNARGVSFFINDHVDLAMACNARGVHLGQHDLPVETARLLMGESAVIGISTNTVEEAQTAVAAGADYIAVGAIYSTGSKANTRPAGLQRLRDIRAAVDVSIVAIGGITLGNASDVIAAGADFVAVIGALANASAPEAAARDFASLFA